VSDFLDPNLVLDLDPLPSSPSPSLPTSRARFFFLFFSSFFFLQVLFLNIKLHQHPANPPILQNGFLHPPDLSTAARAALHPSKSASPPTPSPSGSPSRHPCGTRFTSEQAAKTA
jgi:hypothetical protein